MKQINVDLHCNYAQKLLANREKGLLEADIEKEGRDH